MHKTDFLLWTRASSSSGVSFGGAPVRRRECKASLPPSCTAFIHLLTAAFVTPSASASSSWVQPSFLSSSARKRRISSNQACGLVWDSYPNSNTGERLTYLCDEL